MTEFAVSPSLAICMLISDIFIACFDSGLSDAVDSDPLGPFGDNSSKPELLSFDSFSHFSSMTRSSGEELAVSRL